MNEWFEREELTVPLCKESFEEETSFCEEDFPQENLVKRWELWVQAVKG